MMTRPETISALLLFVWAAYCQLSGAYLLWNTVRGNKSAGFGVVGCLLLVASAYIMSLQKLPFGRIYAGYAGILSIMAIIWGWHYTRIKPDVIDLIGMAMVLGGIGIIFFIPRK